MEDLQILENATSEFLTFSFADQSLDLRPEQSSNECTNISNSK